MRGEIDRVLKLLQTNLDNWMTQSNLKTCLGCIDLTTLNSTDTKERVLNFTKKVNNFKSLYPDYPTPAAICVYPNFGGVVKGSLKAEGVKVAVVAGGFPTSQTFLDVKLLECKMAVESGADEVDIVLPLNLFLANDIDGVKGEIAKIKEVIGEKHLKVILETGALGDAEKIAEASMCAMEAGADFIKTSTGKQEPAATPMAAIVMCHCIKEYYAKTGRRVGFKPAGGISTAKDAICYYAIVDTILGKEWLNPRYFRIGASRLANNILSELEQKTIGYY